MKITEVSSNAHEVLGILFWENTLVCGSFCNFALVEVKLLFYNKCCSV